MSNNLIRALVVCGVLTMVGCNTTNSTLVAPKEFSQKATESAGNQISLLVSGDSIEVSVEVDGRMEVSAHRGEINHFGKVTLPLVGDVKVGGLTMGNARSVIANTYGAYFVSPPVIMVSRMEDSVSGEWGYVTVTGKVQQPGRVKVLTANGIRLTAVIQESGGFSPSAKSSGIRISRIEKDGRRIQVSVDYNEIGQDGNVDADVNLLDGDIVYVPERIF
jgi:polysaccharide export outer membrane protein